MSKVWFTSDLHFGHRNILTYCPNRPFKTIEEHDAALIAEWQSKVAFDDDIYFLGDLTLSGDASVTLRLLERLPGKIHLVLGNHDRGLRKVRRIFNGTAGERDQLLLPAFEELTLRVDFMERDDEVEGMYRFRRDGRSVLMSHHPVEDWPGMAWHGRGPKVGVDPLSGRWHLHGHSHGMSRPMPGRLDVGWDTANKILSWEEIQAAMYETAR